MRALRTTIFATLILAIPIVASGQQQGDLSGRTLILNDGGPAITTKNTITFRLPDDATITANYSLIWPSVAGTPTQLLRVASVAGSDVTLGWSAPFATSPYEEATAGQSNIRRITSLTLGPVAVPAFAATDLQSSRTLATQTASANYAFVGGGSNNSASGLNSGVLAGDGNIAGTGESVVAGGLGNSVSGAGFRGAILGGQSNNVSGNRSLIVGGLNNSNTASVGVLVGGEENNVSGSRGVIVGGYQNTSSANYGFIGTGSGNNASGNHSAIITGNLNTNSGDRSVIVSGDSHTMTGGQSIIGAGGTNSISANFSAILGGENNSSASQYGAIWGGQNLALTANNIGGYNSGVAMTINQQNVVVFGNNNVLLANTNNTRSQLRLFEAQPTTGAFPTAVTQFVGLRSAAVMANDNIYDLPSAVGAAGDVLKISVVAGNDATLIWGPDLGGAVVQNVGVIADNQVVAVNAGVTYLVLTSNGAPVARTVTFTNGANIGQLMVVKIVAGAGQGVEMLDAGTFQLSGNYLPQNNDTITLIWDGAAWLEVARRNN